MKFQFPANNFTSGEWSDKMIARTDTDQYARSARSLENVLVQMQGGAFKRPGFMKTTLDSAVQASINGASQVRIFPWLLSDGSRCVLIATNDKPVSGTYQWYVYDETTSTSHALSVVLSGRFPDIVEPDLSQVQFCQSGDVLFLAAPNVYPRFLRKEGSNFVLRGLQEYYTAPTGAQDRGSWKAMPYGQFNSSGSGGNITVTVSSGTVVNLVADTDIFDVSMTTVFGGGSAGVATNIKFTSGGLTGVVQVFAVTDARHAQGLIMTDAPNVAVGGTVYGTATGTAWEMSAWNPYYGYPRTVTAYQGRLIFGGNARTPDTIWGSQIGNIYNFMEVPFAQSSTFTTFGSDNTRPFTMAPNSKEASNIRCLSASKMLVINTDRSEIVAYGSQGALGPLDVTLESSTSFGAEPVQPVRINNYLTFVQRGGRKLRDIIFSFDEYQYKSNDLMFPADHLTIGDPMREIVATEQGSSILFARTYQGNLISATLDRDYQVNAWSHHILGGSYSGGRPQVVSMCTLPASSHSTSGFTSDCDSLYILVKRTINGATVISFEKLARIFDPTDTLQTLTLGGTQFPQYLDGAYTAVNLVLGTPTLTTTFTLTELANETVSVLADGVYIGERTISNTGVLTLPNSAKAVMVGYKYSMKVQPCSIEQGVQVGTPQGVSKRAHETYVRLWKSYPDGQYGRGTDLYSVPVPSTNFTGDLFLKMPPGYSRTYTPIIQSLNPVPFNVIAMIYQGMSYD